MSNVLDDSWFAAFFLKAGGLKFLSEQTYEECLFAVTADARNVQYVAPQHLERILRALIVREEN